MRPDAHVVLRWACAPVEGQPLDFSDRQDITLLYARSSSEPAGSDRDYGLCRRLPDGSLQPVALPVWKWEVFYIGIIRSIFNGTWGSEASGKAVNYWWGMSSGVIDVRVTENCPDSMAELVDILKRGISSGLIMPFHRKITAQSGGAINDGTRWLSPDELLHMDWLCSCVEGSIPGFDELLPMAQPMVRLLGVYRDALQPKKRGPLL